MQQCFFGEHLLTIFPTATVAIVESEKSAMIASLIMPELICLATGGIQGLSIEKCQVLKNRNVILFPDLGAFEKWSLKAQEISKYSHCVVSVSTILQYTSTSEEKLEGLDIADYLIAQMRSKHLDQIM